MLTAYFTYVLLGISLSIPTGAMTVQMTKHGLRNGFMHGWLVGLGGMTIDFLLILTIYFGFTTLMDSPWIELTMWLLGFFFLLFIGYESLKESKADVHVNGDDQPKASFFKAYMDGFIIAITPANLVFWLGVFGPILISSLDKANFAMFMLISFGIISGILIHDLFLLSFLHFTRKFLSESFMKWVSFSAGIILIGFSVYFCYKFFKLLSTII